MADFPDFFRTATGREPYAYQREFATALKLPDLLEAPTGSGKTATAVLGWLWRRRHGSLEQRAEAGRRLVFCLPMRTLVEQTERAATSWRRNLGLDHEVGVHLLLGGAVDDAWAEHPDRDAILIGTQDQLLSRALMRGYAMSRFLWPVHFALLNSDCTWIMDEVQLMGVGASTAAQLQAFREQLGVAGMLKTVWMTATLAEGRLRTVDVRRQYSRQPFVSDDPPLKARLHAKKVLSKADATSGKKGTLDALAREIAAAHVPGTLTLVVMNRVQRAQELRALLALQATVEATALIHSRFRPADRRRVQEVALSGSFAGVLVATQAIEAGVDISAKTLFTELAPWPSLVQRFGRLNRGAEHESARAVWVDLDTNDAEQCLPYDMNALVAARSRLLALSDVSPSALASVAQDPEQPTLPVVRRKDLLELFDTEPDLAGHDIDVSRYIRATDDRDVQLAWRSLGEEPPSPDAPDLYRDELCSVPIHELKKLAKNHDLWRFDSLKRKWVKVDRPFPGLACVADVSLGGYSEELGYTRDPDDVPNPVAVVGAPPDSDPADPLTYGASAYVPLVVHAEDTAQEMQRLLGELRPLVSGYVDDRTLLDAARWHDAGKTHAAFQTMLVAGLPPHDPRRQGGPWAKSDGQYVARNARRFFRHELASALAWLAQGHSDLGGYLVAAHHGKVRVTLRARPGEEPPPGENRRFAHGVYEGDQLPETDLGSGMVMSAQTLSLACMELGGAGVQRSWSDRMLRLLQDLGPFRLAYLEMLVRVADWRASRKRAAAPSQLNEEVANVAD